MKSHKAIQKHLYEFVRAELSASDRLIVERHLAACSRCSAELNTLRQAMTLLAEHSKRPSEYRGELYWQQFSVKVDRRIERVGEEDAAPSIIQQMLDAFVEHRKPFGIGFASALTLLMIGFGVWSLWIKNPTQHQIVTGEIVQEQSPSAIEKVSIESRAEDYLDQSKVLLIGIMNSDPTSSNQSMHLSRREQEVSRKLVSESEHLTSSLNDPSQRRLKELISDLQLILVQIANVGAEHNAPGIEIVKGGIEHNDILFKINLEEIQRTKHAGKSGISKTQVKSTI